MDLAIVIVILIYWAIRAIAEKLRPPAPPIEDIDKYLVKLRSLPNEAARQKYCRNRKPGDP